MTSKPKISIIIPVYNTAEFLPRCLDSVLGQTFADWQAICVNDGSTDNSGDILAEYAARDSRIVVVNQDNAGASQARNTGIGLATGEYVLYLDSDDFIHCQTLEILYFQATRHNADMVSFGYDVGFHRYLLQMLFDGKDISGLLPASCQKKYRVDGIRGFVTDDILSRSTERNHSGFHLYPVRRHCFPVLCLYRRKLIADLPFIRGIIFEDFPWWVSVMLRRPRTVMIKKPLYFYMPNLASALNSSRARRMIESIVVGLQHTFENAKKHATDSEFNRLNKEFLWPFIIIAMRKVRDLDKDADINAVREKISNLYNVGVFDVPPTRRARRYYRRIREFIGK